MQLTSSLNGVLESTGVIDYITNAGKQTVFCNGKRGIRWICEFGRRWTNKHYALYTKQSCLCLQWMLW